MASDVPTTLPASTSNVCNCAPTASTIVPPIKTLAYGENQELAGVLQIGFDLFLFIIQLLFIRGARHLTGWKSEYSFVLLILLAFNAIQCYVLDIVGVFFSLLTINDILNWQKSQRIFRILGAFYGVPQFTVYFITVWLSIHRCFYIFFPLRAQRLFTPRIAQTSLITIVILHFGACVLFSSDLMGLRYYPPVFTFSIKAGLPFTNAMIEIAQQTNILVPMNMILYSFLVAYIIFNKKISINGNYDVRFTLQAFITVLLEMALFVYNYVTVAKSEDPWILILFRTLTQQLYVAFHSITYLLVNREVRRGALGMTSSNAVSRIPSLH